MNEAVKPPHARPARLADRVAQPSVLIAALGVFVLVLVAIRIWLSGKIVTPWLLSDELLYSELARSFADDHRFLVRGAPFPIYGLGYPLLVSPAWLAGSMAQTYELAKTINVV